MLRKKFRKTDGKKKEENRMKGKKEKSGKGRVRVQELLKIASAILTNTCAVMIMLSALPLYYSMSQQVVSVNGAICLCVIIKYAFKQFFVSKHQSWTCVFGPRSCAYALRAEPIALELLRSFFGPSFSHIRAPALL
jgi:hypothetical protein